MTLVTMCSSINTDSGSTLKVDGTLQRINYGTVFKDNGHIIISNEYWRHTFEVPLPTLHSIQPFVNTCGKIPGNACNSVKSIITNINIIQQETRAKIAHLFTFIQSHIPIINIKKKSKRALLPFIGSLSKSFFGTATMDDVNLLASHLNALQKQSIKMANALSQHGSHLSSYMTTSNRRMDNIQFEVMKNYYAIGNITKNFQSTITNIETHILDLTNLLNMQSYKASSISSEVNTVISSLQSLIEGKLTPVLIPIYSLHKTIQDINHILATNYSRFTLVNKEPQWYYQHATFHFGTDIDTNSIYITIKFPVSPEKEPLKLYEIISLPVPINATSSHATMLLNLPQYLAITSHQQYYVTMEKADLATCKKHGTYLCSFNKALTPVTQMSCVMGLFANDKSVVNKFCDFRFMENHLSPTAIELSATSVLIYNSFNLVIDCPKYQDIKHGCSMCVMTLPCQCSITTKHWYFPPRLVKCHKQLNKTEVFHPINLALLQQFFNESKLISLAADSVFSKQVNVLLPMFNMYNHSFQERVVADQKLHLNMKKMVQAAKNDEQIFQSLTEPLLEGEINVKSVWPDTNGIIVLCTLGLTILTTIACILSMMKIRKLSTTLLILQQTSHVRSEKLPSFVYSNPTNKIQKSTVPSISSILEWDHLILALLICITIMLIFILFIIVRRRNRGTTVLLELTSGKHCVIIPLIYLPLCPSFLNIEPPFHISNFTLSDFSSCNLKTDWTGFKIKNVLNEQSLEIQNVINLSWINWYKTSKVLKHPYMAYILLQHDGLLTPLPDIKVQENIQYFKNDK